MSKIDEVISQVTELLKGAFAPKVNITKSVEVEARRALFVAMQPEVEDAHGHTVSAIEIEKACHNFNKHCGTANLFHLVETSAVDIQESFIAPVDLTFENGREILKGSWCMWMHFPEGNPEADAIWEMVKTGDINGISIGALGYITEE